MAIQSDFTIEVESLFEFDLDLFLTFKEPDDFGVEFQVFFAGDWVIKQPNCSMFCSNFYMQKTTEIITKLADLMPETFWDRKRRLLIQRYIEGDPTTFEERWKLAEEIKRRMILPCDIFANENVLTDKNGRHWLIDIGHFEKLPLREEGAY